MKIQQVLAFCAVVMALQTSVWGQNYAPGNGVRRPVAQASYRSPGCSTCGPVMSAPACGTELSCGAGPSCGVNAGCAGSCGSCRTCCPRILPAIVRGLDCAIDRVGDTLACIFNPPRYSCCAAPFQTQACCVAKCPPRVSRICDCGDSCRANCGVNVGPSCGAGCSGGSRMMPNADPNPFKDEPEAPPVPPAAYRMQRTQAPAYSHAAPRGTSSTAIVKPAGYSVTNKPVSRPNMNCVPTPAQPRPFSADQNASALSPDDVKVKSIRRTSATEPTAALGKNPLR